MEQIPTIHMGSIASQMERKGRKSERGEINRQIKEDNRILREIKKRIKELALAVKEIAKGRIQKLAKLLENIRSHFIVTEYQDINIDLEQMRLDNKSIIDEEVVERCISIDKEIENTKDANRLYELREERIIAYTKAGYTSKRDVESAMSVINDRRKTRKYLEGQKAKLSKIKEKTSISYKKELQSVLVTDKKLLAMEQLQIRGGEEENARELLITQYGERFRENTFQEAVKRTDAELNGISMEKEKVKVLQEDFADLYNGNNEGKDHKTTSKLLGE